MTRVLVVGDVITDISAIHSGPLVAGSDQPATIRISGGGSAANTAAWLAVAGCRVDLVGVAGTDRAGDDRIAELTATGVGCTAVRRVPDARTGSVIVLVEDGERTMLSDRGANVLLEPSDVDLGLQLSDVDHLHLSGYVLLDPASQAAGRHALAAARERGLSTSVGAAAQRPAGPEVLDWVRGTDLLIANLEEARALLGGGAAEPTDLAGSLARVVSRAVVTLGAAGAVFSDGSGTTHAVPAFPTEVVDSTGAGDAFAAGVLAAWLADGDLGAAVRAGARTAAQSLALVGGRPHVSRGR
jgi:ribokinase